MNKVFNATRFISKLSSKQAYVSYFKHNKRVQILYLRINSYDKCYTPKYYNISIITGRQDIY